MTPFLTFPTQAFPNVVTVRRTPDAVSTRGAGNPTTSTDVSMNASVQPVGAVAREIADPHNETSTWVSVTQYRVSFGSDPQLALGDSILTDDGRVLNVTCKSYPIGGWLNLWRVKAEHVAEG